MASVLLKWVCQQTEFLTHQVSKFDLQDVPCGSGVKNPPVHAGDVGSIPLGREDSPGGGHGNPLQMHAWRIPWTEEPDGATVPGVADSWT